MVCLTPICQPPGGGLLGLGVLCDNWQYLEVEGIKKDVIDVYTSKRQFKFM